MVKISTTLRLNEKRMNTYISAVGTRLSRQGASAVAKRIRQSIRDEGLIDTGRMLHSVIYVKKSSTKGGSRWWVWPDVPYAKFQEYGTGGSTATNGYLRFKPKGSNTFIFRKHTGPVPATHFIRKAMKSTTKQDFLR